MKIFISHSWRDKDHAESIAEHISTHNDVWMDYRNLRPGDPIQAVIDAALEDMDLVLVVWTDNAAGSDGVQREVDTALRLGGRVIPCILQYDQQGHPEPARSGPLGDLLAVDFFHFNGGIVELMQLIHSLQLEKHPELGMQDDPRLGLMRDVQSYMKYLAQFRNARGIEDERAKWVERIVKRLRAYVEETGDQDLIQMLYAAAQNDGTDPEGVGILRRGLEDILPGIGGAAMPGQTRDPQQMAGPDDPWPTPRAEPSEDLLRQRIEAVVPAGTAAQWHEALKYYLSSSPQALEALSVYAAGVGSPAGVQVANFLKTYLADEQDLIPDHLGEYGLLDDAWLIINTAFRLIESGVVPAQTVPLNWPMIVQADHVVRAILPPEVLVALEQYVMQVLQIIANEVRAYQPWMTPNGYGYSPFMAAPNSGGGSWEDQMNDALLGTGLSV